MKKIFKKLLFITLLFASLNVNAATKSINGKNWMSAVDGSIPINELTLPGVHDAASFRLNGEAFTNLYGITQDSPIGTVSWKWGGKTYTDVGLLDMGVRYFDIRYGLYDNPEKTSGYRNAQEKASSHLLTVHNTFDCEYRYDEGLFGIDLHKKTTNEVLMKWVKTFLEKNKNETVIFAISADDGSDNKTVMEYYSQFYQAQIEKPDSNYPTIYYGDHVPTLDEARGKLVIFAADATEEYKYVFKDDENKKQRWFFYEPYAYANKDEKTYTLAFKSNKTGSDDTRYYSIYKQNKYDDFNAFSGSDDKWEYIENTLNQTNNLIMSQKQYSFNAFMLNYTSANNITEGDLFGNPWEFAEDINPKVLKYFKAVKPLTGSYGYILMDWMDPDLAKAIYSVNIDQNEYNITNVGLTLVEGSSLTLIIEIAFIIALIVVITIIIIKKAKNNKKTNNKKSKK